MKPLLLLLLLQALPAAAAPEAMDIRLFSLHKKSAVYLETEGAVSVDGRRLDLGLET